MPPVKGLTGVCLASPYQALLYELGKAISDQEHSAPV
jgi:hypothetical protein